MTDEDEIDAYYGRGAERERLAVGMGALEFERTQEILRRALPPAPSIIADIGGGPGRYASWLAGLGYRVRHRDLMPLHVEQLRTQLNPHIETACGDARELDLDSESVDAVLLLGPLYHLSDRRDRVRALMEAARVVRTGGPVVAAVISRWAPRLDGIMTLRLYREFPAFLDIVTDNETTGRLAPAHVGGFSAFTHRPDDLKDEIADAGLELIDLVGVEGMPLTAADAQARRSDPHDWSMVLEAARAVERVPELLGVSPHLIATARRRT